MPPPGEGRTGEQMFRPLHVLFYSSVAWLETSTALGGPIVAQALAGTIEELRDRAPGRLLGRFGSSFVQAMSDPFRRQGNPAGGGAAHGCRDRIS